MYIHCHCGLYIRRLILPRFTYVVYKFVPPKRAFRLLISNRNNFFSSIFILYIFCTQADKAASNKVAKYKQIANSHIFVPVAIESAGTWNHQAVELVQELG